MTSLLVSNIYVIKLEMKSKKIRSEITIQFGLIFILFLKQNPVYKG
jgi:hypothetical protein